MRGKGELSISDDLRHLVDQDIASSVASLMMAQTGLKEHPVELAQAVACALLKEAAILRTFVCKRTAQDPQGPENLGWVAMFFAVQTEWLAQDAKRSLRLRDGID